MQKSELTLDRDIQQLKREMVEAYEASDLAYRLTWDLGNSMAIHYGFSDETTQSFSDTLHRMNEVVCARAHISASDTVLDAGCGVGGSAIHLAKTIGCKVVGVNLSRLQLKKAKRKVKQNKLEDLVTIQYADFTDLPYADSSFDVVWAIESVFHAHDKTQFLKEAYRVLKPNGRLVIADYLQGDAKRFTKSDERKLKTWFKGFAIPELLSWEQFESQMHLAGFSATHSRDISRFVLPSSKRLYRFGKLAKAFWPLVGFFFEQKGMKASQPESLIAQYSTLKKSLWKYALIYAEKI